MLIRMFVCPILKMNCMKKTTLLLLCFLFFTVATSQVGITGNVGINTVRPQQKLHIAGNDASFKIEAFDSLNNSLNRDRFNAPLYIDSEGDLTLDFDLFHNSNNSYEIDPNDPASSIYQIELPIVDQEIFSRTITVEKPSYLEIKFSVSFEIYLNSNHDKITDQYARVISNYFLLNYSTARKYGMTSKSYINSHEEGVSRTYYNNASTYISLPVGTHTISFFGSVGSKSGFVPTYVTFGVEQDQIMMRIY